MSISNCPKCEAEVLLPASTDAAARVKCPLCDEEYTLGDVLEKLPPALVLLDVPALAETASAGGDFGAMFGGDGPSGGFSFDADGPDLQLAEDDDSSGVSFGGEEGAAATATLTTSPRKQKPPKSIGKELVKIVLGGVGGLVIAYGVLLWGFGRDPLPIAPELPPQMLWVIPKDLRAGADHSKPKQNPNGEKQKKKQTDAVPVEKGPEPTTDFVTPDGGDIENKFDGITEPDDTEPDDTAPESDTRVAPDGKRPSLDEPDLESPEFDPFGTPDTSDDPAEIPTLDEPKTREETPGVNPKAIDPDDVPLAPIDPEPTIPEPAVPESTVPEPVDPEPAIPETADPEDANPEPGDPKDAAGLKTTEPISEKDLHAEWDSALSAIKTLSPENPAERASLSSAKFEAHSSLCELAWARTRAQSSLRDPAADRKTEGLGKAVTALDAAFANIAADETQAKVIGQLANVALTRNATKSGMFLTGMVGEIDQVGELHRVSVVLPAFEPKIKVQVITVLCRDLPELKLNDQILVIGAVINHPVDEITGFKGKNEQVIWAADLRRIDSTPTPSVVEE